MYADAILPLGIINTEFHQSNFGTEENLQNVTYDSITKRFSNIGNTNPFVKKQATIISILKEIAIGNTLTFQLDPNFYLYKEGKRIKSLQLEHNGNWFSLIQNYVFSSQNISFSSSGTKSLKFLITYEDNSLKTTYTNTFCNCAFNYSTQKLKGFKRSS